MGLSPADARGLLIDLGIFVDRGDGNSTGRNSTGRKAKAKPSPYAGQDLLFPVWPETTTEAEEKAFAAVCNAKRMPIEAAKQYGAYPCRRGTAIGMAIPMIGRDAKVCGTLYLNPESADEAERKGKIVAGGHVGLFLPGVMPNPGERWIVVEGPKDAAAVTLKATWSPA